MSADEAKPDKGTVWNVPNQVTALRLILAVALFCVMPWGSAGTYLAALVLFVVAAGTDWLDGWYARRYGLVTVLGRILDPFADKVIVCGTFIFLVAEPALTSVPFGLRAWMVVVIVGRELLVTVLRGFIEQQGGDFSAKMSGKLKMVLQCVAAAASLYYLFCTHRSGPPTWVVLTMIVSVWAAVLLTVYSGLVYVAAALRMVRARD
jgi:CDP-diacylglycerol--glycerol-3-phosphate 3-phosphatidyltransferase